MEDPKRVEGDEAHDDKVIGGKVMGDRSPSLVTVTDGSTSHLWQGSSQNRRQGNPIILQIER